jgi:hypothetical protein
VHLYVVDLLPEQAVVILLVVQPPHTASDGVIGQVQSPVEQAAVRFDTEPDQA